MPFTYAGPSTAAVLTVGVLNDAITNAQAKTDQEQDYVKKTLALTENPIIIGSTPQVGVGVNIPTPPIVNFDPNTALSLFESMRSEITNQLTSDFTSYLTNYFPLGTEIIDASAWVKRALTTGGTGINANVEAQLWNRDRDRLMADERRSEHEVERTWAAKRYPLPPGAMTYQVAQTRLEMQKAIGESSRTQATKAWDVEIENVRMAVDKAIDLRKAAVSTALDYIRALALGPQLGVQLASTLLDAQARVATVVTEFYRAQVAAAELPLKIGIENAELVQRTNEANQKSRLENLQQRVNTTMAAAQALATQAAAILNGFHASVGVSGQESL